MKHLYALALAVALLWPLSSQAQPTRGLDCGSYGSGSVLPPECMYGGKKPGTVTIAVTDIESIQEAARSKPTSKDFPRGKSFVSYDLVFENLCEGQGNIRDVAKNWVGERKTGFTILSHDRSVALVAALTFRDAQKQEAKQVKVPLVVRANFGDAAVQNCDGTIMSDIPTNERVNLHFEFKRSSALKFADNQKFLGGIVKVASGGADLVSYGGSSVFAPAVTSVLVSFLTKNSDPVKKITDGANDILASFGQTHVNDPEQWPIDANAEKVTYRANKRDVFRISKTARVSRMVINSARGWEPVRSDFERAFGKRPDEIFTDAQTSADSPWFGNMKKFCEKLRLKAQSGAKGDRIATALVIGLHAFDNRTEYQPGGTCLNPWEIANLKELGYASPFPDAWKSDDERKAVAAATKQRRPGKATGIARRVAKVRYAGR